MGKGRCTSGAKRRGRDIKQRVKIDTASDLSSTPSSSKLRLEEKCSGKLIISSSTSISEPSSCTGSDTNTTGNDVCLLPSSEDARLRTGSPVMT